MYAGSFSCVQAHYDLSWVVAVALGDVLSDIRSFRGFFVEYFYSLYGIVL